MQEIKFKTELMEKILSGCKKATTRLGFKDKYHLGLVRMVDTNDVFKPIEKFEITRIEALPFHTVSRMVAYLEDYKTIEEYRQAVRNCYRPIFVNDESIVTVIEWQRAN